MVRKISAVLNNSLAQRHGLKAGDTVLSINGEPLIDDIDYQDLTAKRHVIILVKSENGENREYDFVKSVSTPLGIQFDDSLICSPKTCGNHCLFCFIDQMPQGMRQSLYVKDDDWRLSIFMGNFVTLTNVSDREFARILRRKASPLYISVHATDPEIRTKLIRNPHASQLNGRLQQLKSNNLNFHCQVVLCPGINDGDVLEKTLTDLLSFVPAALSVALVPVGLTKYRECLSAIRSYTQPQALEVMNICDKFQKIAQEQAGTRFVFPADEFLSIAHVPIPDANYYEHFGQIENGIGMLRMFEVGLQLASTCCDGPMPQKKTVVLPCGTSVAPYLRDWIDQFVPNCINTVIRPIRNDFFGESVTVTGLICAQDLIRQLLGLDADEILIADNMLNSEKTHFLDDLTPVDVENALGIPVRIFPNDGESFFHMLVAPPGQGTLKEKNKSDE